MIRAKVDKNQPELVKFFRGLGFLVSHRHGCHKGVPDLEIGFGGYIIPVEIKDPEKPPSARKLTPDQIKYFDEWSDFPILVILTKFQILSLKNFILEKPLVNELLEYCRNENKKSGY